MEPNEYLDTVQIFNQAYDDVERASISLLGIESEPNYQFKNRNAMKRLKEIVGLDREFNLIAIEIVAILDPDGTIINQENVNSHLIENAFHQDLMDKDSAIHHLINVAEFSIELKLKLNRLRFLAQEALKLVYEI